MNKLNFSLLTIIVSMIFISCENATESQISDNLNSNNQAESNLDLSDLKESDYDIFHLSSNCDDIVIGTIQYENSAESDIEIRICEDDSAGELDDINLGLGSELLTTSVEYSQEDVDFPAASFETEWTGNTEWYYFNAAEQFFETSDNQSISTVVGGVGSEFVELRNLSVTKDIKKPGTPTLVTANGADLDADNALYWQEPGGGPSVEYEINITGPSYDEPYFTSSTNLPLADKDLQIDDTYSWKVRGINAEEEEGQWSQTRTFTFVSSFSVTINGPTQLTEIYDGSLGEWSASVDGGSSPYTYEWEGRLQCRAGHPCNPYHGNWINIGSGGNEAAWLFSDNDASLDIRLKVTDDNDHISETILYNIIYYPDI